MVDDHNRVILVHGINAVWKIPPYFPPDTATGFTGADAQWLSDHGFNAVRLGVLFAGVMPQEGVISTDYLDRSNRVMQLLAEHGIRALIDVHQDLYGARFQGDGFPDWATYDDGIPPANSGFPATYFTPACSRAFDNFWNNKNQLWDQYRDAWKAVAKYWRDQPYLLGYNLINEPWPGTDLASCASPQGCQLSDTTKLQGMQDYVLTGIREVDQRSIIWYQPYVTFNSGAKTNLGLLNATADDNLGFSYHKYCIVLYAPGLETYPACDVVHRLVSDNAEEAMQRMHATGLITEFGRTDNLTELKQVTSEADRRITGWLHWNYKDWDVINQNGMPNGTQGMFHDDADLGSVKLEKLKILERTYPQATAGIPLDLNFDPDTGEFLYRYQPRLATAPTEIYVPVALHYPNGYHVEIEGRRSLSPVGSKRLLVGADDGAAEVTIRVRRVP